MSYASASDVAAYTPNLLSQSDNFTDTTRPTRTQVERWLSSGCSVIEARLRAAGYSTPVGAGTVLYDQVSDLEAIFAAARAEMVRMSARVGATERTRSQMFKDMFDKELGKLLGDDLSKAGLSHTSDIYIGGISESDKDTDYEDTDRVQARFKRGAWRYPGTSRPSSVADDESE